MKQRLKVSLVQFATEMYDKEANLKKGIGLLEEACRGSDLVLLPETAFTGYTIGQRFWEYSEPIPGRTTSLISDLAKKNGTFIAFGMGESDGSRIYNTCVLIGPDGEIIARHRKAHLYAADVKAGFTAGDSLRVWNIDLGIIGLLVCMDSQFIESSRVLDLLGVEIILVPCVGVAKYNDVDRCIEDWRIMMQSNGKFGRCYVLRADKVGMEGDWVLIGHSMIIDPMGRVVAEGNMKEGIIRAELVGDMTAKKYRNNNRRPDLYGAIAANFTSSAKREGSGK